ncbi:MAG: proton-conducting transporter membrane subunit [bacterium]
MQVNSRRKSSLLSRFNNSVGFIEAFIWGTFLLSLVVALYPQESDRILSLQPYISVSGLAQVMWPYATLLTGIILNFSKRYMAGNHRLGYFFLRCFMFLVSVMVLSATDHILVFLLAWLSMGWFMAGLIGHKIDWPQARAAGRLALQYFLAGTMYLCVGILVLYEETGTFLISSILENISELSLAQYYLVFACFCMGALIQSSLFPVQDWLMSSMTAPTPASALMHAGFVNAGGILLTKFSTIFVQYTTPMLILAGIGALSAIMGIVWKMVQTAVKRQLGCSTIAQMGFMILQCGLGFFSAAITHLILHGFYKGYLFLNSGNAIGQTAPSSTKTSQSSLTRNLVSLTTGLIGGGVFALLTGKGLKFNSGLFLAFIVVLTLLHSSREIVNQINVSRLLRHAVFPLVALGGTAIYGLIFNGITTLLSELPNVVSPSPLSWVHLVIALCFSATWLMIETEAYKKFDRLYVYILNASQPHPATILSSKEEYHV